MPTIIRAYDNENKPIIGKGHGLVPLTYFTILRLTEGESLRQKIDGYETVCVVMSGTVDIAAGGEFFPSVGIRRDIWSGSADSVYAPPGAEVPKST